jgi:Ricin-type beta-trefoil lectin domain
MKYLIVCQENRAFCLGVTSASSGAPVVLLPTGQGNLNLQWEMDSSSGLITMAGRPSLALAYSGDKPEKGKRIILRTTNAGEVSQTWDWIKKSPAIINVGASDLAIDNKDGKLVAQNIIQLSIYRDDKASQRWECAGFSTLEGLGLQEVESTSAQ